MGASLPLSRRGFLVRSAGASLAFALAGCAGEQEDEYAALLPPHWRTVVLGARELAVLDAVARRLVPGGPDRPGAGELEVATRIDGELRFHPAALQEDVRDALRLVEWWPLATRFARFTRLTDAEKDAELDALRTSPFSLRRRAFAGIKSLVMFFTYSLEPTWPAIGYDGPWVERGPRRTWS